MLRFLGEPGILNAKLAGNLTTIQAFLQAAPAADAAAVAKALGIGWKGVVRRALARLYQGHPLFLNKPLVGASNWRRN
jgi:hypothetical protein